MSSEIVIYAPNASAMERFLETAPPGTELEWVDSNLSLEEQAEQMKNTVAAIMGTGRIPVELVAKCPNLKLVQTISAGTNHLDKAGFGELGVRVSNNGGGNAVAVAEHTIGLIVNTIRKMQLQFKYVHDRKWAGDIYAKWFSQSHEIVGKTVGIVGIGRIGSSVAQRLQGWECELVYSDVMALPAEREEELHVNRLSLDELLQTSDIITLHVPLGSSTKAMISDREFGLMKPTAILINACRGDVVDEAALIRAIRGEKIAAAGLDVLEEEPTAKDNPLLDMDNVLITPHLAGMSVEAMEKSRAFALANAARVARGEDPESVVLPD